MLNKLFTHYNLKMKYVQPLHYISFNGQIEVLTNEELEDIECGLTDLLYAINTHRLNTSSKHCNALQEAI